MDIIKLARELGAAIQQDEDYIAMESARKANDEDEELQAMIEKFSVLSAAAEYEQEKDNPNEEIMESYGQQLQELYNNIMQNVNMARFERAKDAMDEKMNYLISILAAAVNGEDPMTFEPEEEHHCGGDCGGCSGCH